MLSGPVHFSPRLPALKTSLRISIRRSCRRARAADLVKRMTFEENVSQLINQARAIPHLNVPAYDWWSEFLHGVALNGTTEFPEPIGLDATFDPDAIHSMAVVIGTEGRIKHVQAARAGHSNIFEGLDFWARQLLRATSLSPAQRSFPNSSYRTRKNRALPS